MYFFIFFICIISLIYYLFVEKRAFKDVQDVSSIRNVDSRVMRQRIICPREETLDDPLHAGQRREIIPSVRKDGSARRGSNRSIESLRLAARRVCSHVLVHFPRVLAL